MAQYLFANFGQAQLASVLNSGDTTMTVQNVTNLPPAGFTVGIHTCPVVVGRQLVYVTDFGDGTHWTVTQSQEGTTGLASYPVGTLVRNKVSGGVLSSGVAQVGAPNTFSEPN